MIGGPQCLGVGVMNHCFSKSRSTLAVTKRLKSVFWEAKGVRYNPFL